MRFTHWLIFAGGIALGIGSALALLPNVEPLEPAVAAAPVHDDQTDRIKELRALLDQKNALIAEQSGELEELRTELRALRENQAGTDIRARPEVAQLSQEELRSIRARRMHEGMMRAADRESSELIERFNLTGEQAAAVRAFYEEQYNFRYADIQARHHGGEPPTEAVPTVEEGLAEILYPEQMEAFLSYQDALENSRAEIGATTRMNSIAPDLRLTEIQKDQIFATFYEDIRARSSESPTEVNITERMRTILSPDQFARWLEVHAPRSGEGPPQNN